MDSCSFDAVSTGRRLVAAENTSYEEMPATAKPLAFALNTCGRDIRKLSLERRFRSLYGPFSGCARS